MSSIDSLMLDTLKMLLLSLILNLMDPLTVQADTTLSWFLMSPSFLKVALVRSSKKGNLILAPLAVLFLVLAATVLPTSLGANSLRLRNTRLRQYLE